MKKGFINIIVFSMVLFCLNVFSLYAKGSSSDDGQGKALSLKFGHLANTDNNWHKSALKFAEEVKRQTSGSIKVQVFPNEQLGKEVDVINGIASNVADFTITGTTLEQFGAKLVRVMEFPYLFRDEAHMIKAINGTPGKKIADDIAQNTPYMVVGYFLRGPRELTSNRPINNLSDLQGLVVRVPNSPIAVDTWEALGAKPTPMAFSEVFTSLQQGTIDAQENPLAQISDAKFYEVQKYINVTDHVRAWIYVIMSKKRFNSFTPEQQKAIMHSAKVMQEYQQNLYHSEESELKSNLEKQVTFNNNINITEFSKRIKNVLVPTLTPDQRELYDQIQAIQ